MQKIVECVPNFSEGRNKTIIDAIAEAIRSTQGVTLLDVDPGPSTNRTVYTFVGDPDAVIEGALNAARVAYQLIDMAKHTGEHPRLGAMDVCPFVPVRGVEPEECVFCATRLAEKLSAELKVPVYLYGSAARRGKHRVTVPQIRAGEYEALSEKLEKPEWEPDYGPRTFVSQWGATMVGVRPFLLAYNINILGTKEQAHRIALNIREQGRGAGQPGRLKAVQGMGWWLDEANLAQVSLNITNHKITPLHVAFNEVVKESEELRVGVAGSELVGLVPLEALLQAADFFMQKEGLMILEEDQKVRLAVSRLGLSSISPFDPKERVIEYRLPVPAAPLTALSLRGFVEAVGARTPAPGGGSVSALLGSLGSGLATMCGLMTFGRKQWDHLDQTMRKILPETHDAMKSLIPMIDSDSDAFNQYMAASKMPKSSTEEAAARDRALTAALDRAIQVPLDVANLANNTWPAVIETAKVCNIQTASDMQVAARCLEASVAGAWSNVLINLGSLSPNDQRRTSLKLLAADEMKKAADNCKLVLDIMQERMETTQ
ncbi:formimidoyltransferase-cyclodeaminase-like [Cloeon dipterum]|uniref:formimidoyltransferase-cyclodeaminase-like n=1 Tax=Cloeon dipterum TaxID=197152 RepID=UPI00321FA225